MRIAKSIAYCALVDEGARPVFELTKICAYAKSGIPVENTSIANTRLLAQIEYEMLQISNQQR